MYICNCEGVTERQIRIAIQNGADSMSALRDQLSVASNCGKCARDVKCMLRDTAQMSSCANGGSFSELAAA